MTLAARLDRLRGTAASSDVDGVTERLRRARGLPDLVQTSAADDAALCRALDAQGRDGLLIVERRVDDLPVRTDAAALPETRHLSDVDWVYLDTETTGLSGGVGNLAFMVGLARHGKDGRLHVCQLLLSRFDAEAAMLRAMVDWIGPRSVVASYNGKCFDAPLLQSRLRLHRVEPMPSMRPHLDLMYPVRNAFRRHWPDCRLQTAERRLLAIRRCNDLPGAEAPAAWQAWLRDHNPRPLLDVLRHNFQDVISLVLLHDCLAGIYRGEHADQADQAAIGRAWRAAGDEIAARRIWRRAGEGLAERGKLWLAASCRRAGDLAAAERIWLQLAARGNTLAACELSKFYEHHRRDLPRALRFAMQCPADQRAVRLARLRRKLGNASQMSLWQMSSAGEGDHVAGAVGDRQAVGECAVTTRVE